MLVLSALGKFRNRRCLAKFQLTRCLSGNPDDVYDLLVIGGGSGGLACSKEAADLGKRVAVLDYVDESPQGSKWGLGGTCVNVGCIPKKIMHMAASLGTAIKDSSSFGWNYNDKLKHDWGTLVNATQQHIRSLNWGHRVQLKDKRVDYFNARGHFISSNTVAAVAKDGSEKHLHAHQFVIAVGGRPNQSNIPGSREYGITSDDMFAMRSSPGKTLVVGGSYVALECAGFLTGLGFDTTVMYRSILLRGFDQQIAGLIGDNMAAHGTKMMPSCVPLRVVKQDCGALRVDFRSADNYQASETFDTVLFAIGRTPATKHLNLPLLGIETTPTGHIVGGELSAEQTSATNVFAIGDALHGRPELTPVAIMAGKLLARRLFASSSLQMDYNMVPTTVFTPLEYGAVGLSEEDAIRHHGDVNVEVYHAFYKPLDYSISGRDSSQCYIKLLSLKSSMSKSDRVVGLHFLGPNAGEVMQGFAAALRVGISTSQLLSTVGIHPTSAEEVVKLHITKASGLDPTVTGC